MRCEMRRKEHGCNIIWSFIGHSSRFKELITCLTSLNLLLKMAPHSEKLARYHALLFLLIRQMRDQRRIFSLDRFAEENQKYSRRC